MSTSDDLSLLRKKCVSHARKKNFGQYAEDFASYATLKRLRGRSVHVQRTFIDYCRTTFGKPGSIRNKINLNYEELKKYKRPKEENIYEYVRMANEIYFESESQRLLFFMRVMFDLEFTEIAAIFGIPKQAAVQRFYRIRNKVKK